MKNFYLEKLDKKLEVLLGATIRFDQANSSSLPHLSSELNKPLE
jgi:hypothetical protein